MGLPMARNLLARGFDVVGYNRTPARGDALVEAGGWVASSVATAVSGADVIATMLPDSPDVLAVLAGEEGVFVAAKPGALIVDFSTIRPAVSIQLAERARDRALRILDAPVSGGEQGAVDGTLSIMVGGDAEDFEAARPILEAVGRTLVYIGPAGSGQIVKAANQLIVAGTIELVAEAIVLLEAHGVNMTAALKVLGGGLAGSSVIERKGPSMVAREFVPGFRVELHCKDMGIVMDAARQAGVVLPLGSLAGELLAAAKARGDGELDHSAMLKVVDELCGRTGRLQK